MHARPFANELRVAVAAVREAAALCRSVQSGLGREAMEKKDRSPVTVADFGSQALVCRALAESFLTDPVVAEEDSDALRLAENAPLRARVVSFARRFRTGDDQEILGWIDHGKPAGASGRFWTLDPIDGTKGFLRNEQYAVALALIVDGVIEVAALACPNLPTRAVDAAPAGTVFSAVRGQGAWAVPLDDGDAPPIRVVVSDRDDALTAKFCESVEVGHSAHGESASVAALLGIVSPPVRLDSQAKYAVVARGEADIYLRLPTRADYLEKIWDHAAGALVVTEAGGRVTDVAGLPLDFTRGHELSSNRGVVVTNSRLHDRVLDALKTVGVG